ncbi:ankyrin repeat and SAM domain-containing protein 6-like isoform X2 [Iris pallida]|uniref:Ankyrin repeat and SAM domain-containing protein 6-like isoform X2 n=1 Tax=Iris pallida TaxID=29817 RepID=A0AAX6G809_IRIPA|nr:ankyrin repeat and SAM domain-containing protein 6-like isoform X2 [Iris pallida]
MYADRVATGDKRSVRDRLDVNVGDDFGRGRSSSLKRQRQSDDKWKHDLYEDARGPGVSKNEVGAKDLRLKLQKKSSQQAHQGSKESGVRDLREKLSGSMKSQPTNTAPKAKIAQESVKPIKTGAPATEPSAADTKKVSPPTSSSKKSQKKSELSVDGLLCSLGLEKYSIQFKAEEIDMAALMHMTDDDLKAMGIPMGPRKKILTALDSGA